MATIVNGSKFTVGALLSQTHSIHEEYLGGALHTIIAYNIPEEFGSSSAGVWKEFGMLVWVSSF